MAKKKWCWYCKFRGQRFRVNGEGHVHCDHPSIVHPISPWETLRRCWDVCKDFVHESVRDSQ